MNSLIINYYERQKKTTFQNLNLPIGGKNMKNFDFNEKKRHKKYVVSSKSPGFIGVTRIKTAIFFCWCCLAVICVILANNLTSSIRTCRKNHATLGYGHSVALFWLRWSPHLIISLLKLIVYETDHFDDDLTFGASNVYFFFVCGIVWIAYMGYPYKYLHILKN